VVLINYIHRRNLLSPYLTSVNTKGIGDCSLQVNSLDQLCDFIKSTMQVLATLFADSLMLFQRERTGRLLKNKTN
jgi:hypothetical protein